MPSGVALYCSILRYWFSCLICIHRMKSQNEKQKLVPTWQVPSQESLVNLELLTFCWVRRQSISFWDFPPTPSQVVEVHIDMFLTFVVTCQGNVDWSAVTWQRGRMSSWGIWMNGWKKPPDSTTNWIQPTSCTEFKNQKRLSWFVRTYDGCWMIDDWLMMDDLWWGWCCN